MAGKISELLRGSRRTLPIALSTGLFGLSVGVQAEASGLSLSELALMSAVVFAGSSQAVALELWKHPLPILTIVVTTLFINMRHVPMGSAMAQVFKNTSRRVIFPSLFLMSDSSWAVTMEEQQSLDSVPSFYFFLGSGLTAYFFWFFSTITGHLLGHSISNPSQLGLDFTMSAIFIHLIVGAWRVNRKLTPWVVAALSSVLSARWLPGSWYIVIGSFLGSLTAAWSSNE